MSQGSMRSSPRQYPVLEFTFEATSVVARTGASVDAQIGFIGLAGLTRSARMVMTAQRKTVLFK